MNHTLIGLDLAKNVFHAVKLDRHGNQTWRKKLSRLQLKRYFANRKPTKIAMEACGGSHYWARLFGTMGHEVVLLPPKHVKAYLRGQKNDYNDAQAIAEAAHHGSIRPVVVKTVERQDEQAFHRLRRQRVSQQTRLANQIRGLLGEYGVIIPKGVSHVRNAIPGILEDGENGLTARFRELLHRDYQQFLVLDEELKWFGERLLQQARQDEVCRNLQEIPGFGPVVSSAVKCWMGDGRQFRRGRDASAALGVVPRQYSSGDKDRLYGITKKGDRYTRSLVVNGARSVVAHASRKSDALSCWINRLVASRGYNKAVIALANKLIRIAWVVIARGERYQPREALA
jgi:transposase